MVLDKTFVAAFAVLLVAGARADGLQTCFGLRGIQLYVKPKFDLHATWDQEFGFQEKVLKCGNLSEKVNFGYDPAFPWHGARVGANVGLQTSYKLARHGSLSVYTKLNHNLIQSWKQSFGVKRHVWSYRRNYVSVSVAYRFAYPFIQHRKPSWVAQASFVVPLG
ncbi:MAG: hypothetical protein ACYC96_16770 [Fimbriimonadaceae bacterium]